MKDSNYQIKIIRVDGGERVMYRGGAREFLLTGFRKLLKGAVEDILDFGAGFGHYTVSVDEGRGTPTWEIHVVGDRRPDGPFNIPGWDL